MDTRRDADISERSSSSNIRCSGCQLEVTLEQFIANTDFEPLGMQFTDSELKYNVFYFNHTCADCGTTILVPVTQFLSLIKKTIPERDLSGTDSCAGHCLHISDLAVCNQECYYAPFRRFLLGLIARRKFEVA